MNEDDACSGVSEQTIPVPQYWTPEQAWEAVIRGDNLDGHKIMWAKVIVRDGKFVTLA